jgi:hypothetical protein
MDQRFGSLGFKLSNLFIYSLLDDAISSSDYIASNCRSKVNNKFEMTWKEVVVD